MRPGTDNLFAGCVYPIEQKVQDSAQPFQLKFAKEAADLITPGERINCEATPDGLLLRGITELDLEAAVEILYSHYPKGLRVGKPEIKYVWAPEFREPFVNLKIEAPEEYIGNVKNFLVQRYGTILKSSVSPQGQTIYVEAPLAELFGFSVELRVLTHNLATLEVTFSRYGSRIS